MTELRLENLVMPGARLGAENPLPVFRDPQENPSVNIRETIPPEKRLYLGWQTGRRVLPYRLQDNYTRKREALTFRSIVLENNLLKATFLPDLGGRLISLFHKPLQRELLSRNPVFQPANLAIRNAWFSGGIEWNVGQYGHTFSTCSPLFAAAIQDAAGEPGLRLYEFERCKRLFWHIDFYLPPDSPYLIAYIRVVNPNNADTSMYWWTNTAVKEAEDVRVLAPTRKAIYIDFLKEDNSSGIGYTSLPGLPSLDGGDGTYALNFPFANEFFFQCDDADLPWEAALDGQGSGLIEASTSRLKYRKLFCWGSHQGGRHWQEFLSQPGEAYIEIQAGLAPTQRHGLPMPAGAEWDWTQVFGYIQADPKKVHGRDWDTVWQTVDGVIKETMPVKKITGIEAECRRLANNPSGVILNEGSGWGTLELKRREADKSLPPLPPTFVFPEATLGQEQVKWLHLLKQGYLPEQEPGAVPGEWMVQDEWFEFLEKSLEQDGNRNWFALLYAGVMRLEHFDEQGAAAAWQESIRRRPSAWAYRNLACLSNRQNRNQEALDYYMKAWQLACQSGSPIQALAVEYLQALCTAGQFSKAESIYESLPAEIQEFDRIQILRARITLELNDLESLEKILQREFAVVQEGEVELTDLWFEMWAKRIAAQTGRKMDAGLLEEVEEKYPPPTGIDFRGNKRNLKRTK